MRIEMTGQTRTNHDVLSRQTSRVRMLHDDTWQDKHDTTETWMRAFDDLDRGGSMLTSMRGDEHF